MRATLLVVAILIAGCSGEPTATQDDGSGGIVEEIVDDPASPDAPDKGAVAGVVRNTNGAPLADAQIIILGMSGAAKTNESGRFHVTSVPPGPQTLRVDRDGYLSLERAITVVAAKLTRLNITLVDEDNTNPGFREHLHDLWRGAPELTLFSGAVAHDHAYPPGGSHTLPCVRGFGLNTGAGTDCYAIPLVPEEETIVPPGTSHITFEASWDQTDFVSHVRLRYQAASESEFRFSEPVAPGESLDIPLEPGMADHGHQLNTLWRFFLSAEPQAAGVVLVSEHFNEQFVGAFEVSLVAHKGIVPPEPAHPRYWAGGDTVMVAENLTHHVTGFPAVPRNRDPTATSCSDVLPCFVLPDDAVVPAGTTRLRVILDYDAGTPALEPYLSRKTLGMRTAAVPPAQAALADLRADPPAEIVAGRTTYELDLSEKEADPFYQPRSTWLFLVAHEGEERGETFTEDCWGVIVGCGGTTYRLSVIAINDDWTPELAGIV